MKKWTQCISFMWSRNILAHLKIMIYWFRYFVHNTGSFFLPRDQQRARPSKHTDYEGLAYLGEFPLAWAACCSNESVYNLLLDSGANPDAQDSFGNMILHMVVVCDKLVCIVAFTNIRSSATGTNPPYILVLTNSLLVTLLHFWV